MKFLLLRYLKFKIIVLLILSNVLVFSQRNYIGLKRISLKVVAWFLPVQYMNQWCTFVNSVMNPVVS